MIQETKGRMFWWRAVVVVLGACLFVSGLYESFTGQTPIWRRRPIAGWVDIGFGCVAIGAAVASQQRRGRMRAEPTAANAGHPPVH